MSNFGPAPGASLLTIGAVARLAGKRPSSIRYYEQIGLLPPPVRVSGRRMYDPGIVRTLAVIDTGQRAGLTLDDIKALLSTSPDDRAAVERLRELAERKLPEIAALIERSELVRGWLECAARCECPNLSECPLFGEPSLPPRPGQPSRPSPPEPPGNPGPEPPLLADHAHPATAQPAGVPHQPLHPGRDRQLR